MYRGHDHLFSFSGQSALHSLTIYHQCAAHVPPIFNFYKILHFQPCFGQNFSSQDTNFCSPKTPHFSSKIHSLYPTFGNLCGKHPPKKLSAPPGYTNLQLRPHLYIPNDHLEKHTVMKTYWPGDTWIYILNYYDIKDSIKMKLVFNVNYLFSTAILGYTNHTNLLLAK